MRYISNGGVAALAICLAVLPAASAFAEGGVVNDENDARSFAVREAELASERAAAKDAAPAEAPAVESAEVEAPVHRPMRKSPPSA